jgi:hypothetical protein
MSVGDQLQLCTVHCLHPACPSQRHTPQPSACCNPACRSLCFECALPLEGTDANLTLPAQQATCCACWCVFIGVLFTGGQALGPLDALCALAYLPACVSSLSIDASFVLLMCLLTCLQDLLCSACSVPGLPPYEAEAMLLSVTLHALVPSHLRCYCLHTAQVVQQRQRGADFESKGCCTRAVR